MWSLRRANARCAHSALNAPTAEQHRQLLAQISAKRFGQRRLSKPAAESRISTSTVRRTWITVVVWAPSVHVLPTRCCVQLAIPISAFSSTQPVSANSTYARPSPTDCVEHAITSWYAYVLCLPAAFIDIWSDKICDQPPCEFDFQCAPALNEIANRMGISLFELSDEPPVCYDPDFSRPNLAAIIGGIVAGIVVLCGCAGVVLFMIVRMIKKNQSSANWGTGQSQQNLTSGWPTK